MPQAKKILALASFATLTLSAACQSRPTQYQLAPAPLIAQEAKAPEVKAPASTSLPTQTAQSSPTKPGAVYVPASQPLTDADGRPASGNVVRRTVSKPKRPLVDHNERPASGNVMSRTAASDF